VCLPDSRPNRSRRSPHHRIAGEIDRIRSLGLEELRREWRRLNHGEPPRISRDLLVLALGYRLQEIEHDGLGKATRRKLQTMAKALRTTGRVGPAPSLSLKPGARLVREWRGRTHTVTVTEDGFEYAGTSYPSLTKIAKKITGAHWSGPRFFGLLAASANTGCTSDTIGRSVLIGSKPSADFSFTDQCGSLSVPFTNIPGNNNDAVTQWAWNFGDNNVSMESNPVYKYAAYSVYTVRLVVKSALGCVSDTAQRVLDLKAKPVAAFDFMNGCEHQQVIFNDGSSITSGNIAQWKWDLGNNIASQQPSPSDTYNVYGNYLVKLVVISDKLCISDTLVKTISIEPKPISEFSVTNGCVDQPLLLQNKNAIQFG
jgi:PKD repeat protein